jgi:soluble lytic murein transglycosylase-like protein
VDLVRSVLFAGVVALAPTVAMAEPWADAVAEASTRFGFPEDWVRDVIRAESGGDVRALSPKGAMGLMQLMPETWRRLRMDLSLGADPYQPHDNILAGVAYLRSLYDRYGAPAFLAAYNAGPARLDDYLLRSRPLPAETRRYVARLGPAIQGVAAMPGSSMPPPTVFAIRHDVSSGPAARSQPAASDLFAVHPADPEASSDTP